MYSNFGSHDLTCSAPSTMDSAEFHAAVRLSIRQHSAHSDAYLPGLRHCQINTRMQSDYIWHALSPLYRILKLNTNGQT